jgi:hypothetical protein
LRGRCTVSWVDRSWELSDAVSRLSIFRDVVITAAEINELWWIRDFLTSSMDFNEGNDIFFNLAIFKGETDFLIGLIITDTNG